MKKEKTIMRKAGAIVVVLLFFVSTTVLITTREPTKGDPITGPSVQGEPYSGWYVPGVEWKQSTEYLHGKRNAVDASNNIYVCGSDPFTRKGVIQKLDPDGIVQWTIDFNIPTEMIDLSGGKGDGGKGMDPDEVEWFWDTYLENTRLATLTDIEVDAEQNIVACGTIMDVAGHPLGIMAVKCTPDGEELWDQGYSYYPLVGGVCLSNGLCLDGTAIYVSGTFKINFGQDLVWMRGGYFAVDPDTGDYAGSPVYHPGFHPSAFNDVACDSTYLYCTGIYKPVFGLENKNIDALVSKFSKGGDYVHMATVDKQIRDIGWSIKRIGYKLFVAGYTEDSNRVDTGLLIRASTGPSIERAVQIPSVMRFTDLANRNDEQIVVSGYDEMLIYYYGATYAKSTLTEIQKLPLGRTEDGSDILEGVSVDGNGDAIFSGGSLHLVVIKLDFAYTYVPPYGYE